MKLPMLFMMTHGAAAAASTILMVAATRSGSTPQLVGASLSVLAVIAAMTWHAASRVRTGIRGMELVVADHEAVDSQKTGIEEFDHSSARIAKHAARWETVAARARRQSQEVRAMMSLLNRRDATDEPSSEQLRAILAGLGNSLHSHLSQIKQDAAEMEQHTKAITEGVETQCHAVIKTSTHVKQMSSAIDSVSANAALAKSQIASRNKSATSARQLVEELIEGMNRIRSESQNSEKKLLGLCDPSNQISAIVGTISDIIARTDLLALNASIESIRAGEHGRGFAIVADEVRQLAEQAADATREITSLVDSMQLVTQESIRSIERQRGQVESEFDRAVAANETLQKICAATDEDTSRVQQIADSSCQQRQLAQDVVLAVEQISKIAKANRSGAETICWTIKSLSKSTPQLTDTVDRLRRCGDGCLEEFANDTEMNTPAAPITGPVSAAEMVTVA